MALLQQHQVPDHFKERYIEGAYRPPGSSVRACMASVLLPTNETLNFWTHFLPGLYFLWVLYNVAGEPYAYDVELRQALMIFLLSAAMCPLISAAAHVLSAHSHNARHICFFFDYAALSFYSLGSAVGYKAFIFPAGLVNTRFAGAYVHIAVFNSVMSLVMACWSRFLQPGLSHKVTRTVAFGMPYLFASIPLMYRVLACEAWECREPAMPLYHVQFVFVAMAFAFYSLHLPERLWPCTFDVVGHSHQLFHIAGSLGTLYQIRGVLLDVTQRAAHPSRRASVAEGSAMLVGTVMVVNGVILAVFTCLLYVRPSQTARSYTSKSYGDHNQNGLDAHTEYSCSPVATSPTKHCAHTRTTQPRLRAPIANGDL